MNLVNRSNDKGCICGRVVMQNYIFSMFRLDKDKHAESGLLPQNSSFTFSAVGLAFMQGI